MTFLGTVRNGNIGTFLSWALAAKVRDTGLEKVPSNEHLLCAALWAEHS